ncbi:MAG: hypothetical protein IPP02_07080 [Chitinophagaceae bacterium]|nr:hypothetical protein [Chitinophagaceae bacterium]
MRKKILLYYPPNKRSVAIETLCRAVKDAGHELIILTLTEKGYFPSRNGNNWSQFIFNRDGPKAILEIFFEPGPTSYPLL